MKEIDKKLDDLQQSLMLVLSAAWLQVW